MQNLLWIEKINDKGKLEIEKKIHSTVFCWREKHFPGAWKKWPKMSEQLSRFSQYATDVVLYTKRPADG